MYIHGERAKFYAEAEDRDVELQFQRLVQKLMTLPESERGQSSLFHASRLVELAAFELAEQVGSTKVGKLIELAAQLSELTDNETLSGGLKGLARLN